MFSQEDLNYLEWVVNSSDDNRAWDIWQTLKPAVLAQQTTINQQLNVAIALLNDMVKVWNVHGVIHKDSWYYERANAVIAQ